MDVRGRSHGTVTAGGADRPAALDLRGIAKSFGDVLALDGVDFSVASGSVRALLGENGAGKSTLMRIAYGLLSADAGRVALFGATLEGERHSVRGAIRAGVGMVHQHLSLVPTLTAAENLALGGRGLYRPGDAELLLRRTAESAGLDVPHDVPARELSIVQQQRLEIVKALARGARLLILDEPTAVLAPSEADELLRWIRQFAATGGSVVLVTHKLREALAVADDVTVLRRGRVTFSGSDRARTETELANAIFPEALEAADTIVAQPAGESVVEASGASVDDARGVRRVRGASFRFHRHEIVGIAAVEGAGHRDLLGALAALVPIAAGQLRLPARIAVIPADRARDALVPAFSLTENVALHGLGRRRGLMDWPALAGRTAALLERFRVVAPSPRVAARSLSGGNQQRLVVARELEHDVDLVVADNPTRGLDIRAAAFVRDELRACAARGAAVVFHSSDLDEVLAMATRMFVVFHGDVLEVGLDRDEVARAMLGAREGAVA